MKIDSTDREFQPFSITITFETEHEAWAVQNALCYGNQEGSITVCEVIEAIGAHLPESTA